MNSPFERLWPTIEQEKRGTLINWFPLDYIMYRIHKFSQKKKFFFYHFQLIHIHRVSYSRTEERKWRIIRGVEKKLRHNMIKTLPEYGWAQRVQQILHLKKVRRRREKNTKKEEKKKLVRISFRRNFSATKEILCQLKTGKFVVLYKIKPEYPS